MTKIGAIAVFFLPALLAGPATALSSGFSRGLSLDGRARPGRSDSCRPGPEEREPGPCGRPPEMSAVFIDPGALWGGILEKKGCSKKQRDSVLESIGSSVSQFNYGLWTLHRGIFQQMRAQQGSGCSEAAKNWLELATTLRKAFIRAHHDKVLAGSALCRTRERKKSREKKRRRILSRGGAGVPCRSAPAGGPCREIPEVRGTERPFEEDLLPADLRSCPKPAFDRIRTVTMMYAANFKAGLAFYRVGMAQAQSVLPKEDCAAVRAAFDRHEAAQKRTFASVWWNANTKAAAVCRDRLPSGD